MRAPGAHGAPGASQRASSAVRSRCPAHREVVQADMRVSNGVIHAINKVLLSR
jgi:uncharacterized surface protein with fasciclin (FAS1) repeats